MSLSRRQFIRGAAATLIIPSFADQVLRHFEVTGEPLLEAGLECETLLHALAVDWGGFILIDPTETFSLDPPSLSWRELFKVTGYTIEDGLEGWDLEPRQLDEEADFWTVEWWWTVSGSPIARACDRLEEYEALLGPEYRDDDSPLGYVSFTEGQHPGSNSRWVEVSDDVGLSCLQHRLTRLKAGIRIEVAPQGLYT